MGIGVGVGVGMTVGIFSHANIVIVDVVVVVFVIVFGFLMYLVLYSVTVTGSQYPQYPQLLPFQLLSLLLVSVGTGTTHSPVMVNVVGSVIVTVFGSHCLSLQVVKVIVVGSGQYVI